MKISLRTEIGLAITTVLLATILAIGGATYWNAVTTVDRLSESILDQTADLIGGRVEVLTTRAEAQSAALATQVARQARLGEASVVGSDFARVRDDFEAVLRANRDFGFVTLTLARTGESVRLSQTSDRPLRATVRRRDGSNLERSTFSVVGDRQVLIDRVPDLGIDGRAEPAFIAASVAGQTAWTEAYIIDEQDDRTTPVVSCAAPIYSEDGELFGVVSVDFSLADLGRFLRDIQVGETGYAFLLETREDGQPAVVGHPRATLTIADEGRPRLATLTELGDSAALSLFARVLADAEVGDSLRRFTIEETATLAAYARIDDSPSWIVALIVPREDFYSSIREAGTVVAIFSGLALLVGAALSLVLAKVISRPLAELAAETERIRSLDFAPRPVRSSAREVESLAQGMEQMKTGLRSFAKLAPQDYVRRLLASKSEATVGGERRVLTVSFADLVGFTALTERLEPEAAFEILNSYLEAICIEIERMEGTIDKFNGDDVMAFWGAPDPLSDHALRSVRAALRAERALDALRKELARQERPQLRANYGVATGPVMVGNVGSTERLNYTVIGDAANLASRLQGLNKLYGTTTLVAPATALACGDEILFRHVDWVRVVNRQEPLLVLEALGETSEADDATRRFADLSERALLAYRDRDWQDALDLWGQSLELRPDDSAAQWMVRRCQAYAAEPPPPTWDGAFQVGMK